jgi:hypothetical protein
MTDDWVSGFSATKAQAEPTTTSGGADGLAPMGNPMAPKPELAPSKRAAHYLWAVLMGRIYEVLTLLCPICGGQMRIIAFITHSADIQQILDHIGADCEPPRIAPARGPPLWDDCGALAAEGTQIGPDWDLVAQPAPDYEVEQRIHW